MPKILNILKTNEIAERPGEVHGLRVRVAARQLGVLDVPHQEQGGAEPADDRSGGGEHYLELMLAQTQIDLHNAEERLKGLLQNLTG